MMVIKTDSFLFFILLTACSELFGQDKKYEIKLDIISIRQMFDAPINGDRNKMPNKIVFEETPNKAQGEKLFLVEIQLPISLNLTKLNISYFEGRKVKCIRLTQQPSIIIKDFFVSQFVCIQVFYPIDGTDRYYSCYFLVGEAPGKIRFTSNDLASPLSSFELTNVLRLDDIGYGEYRSFVGKQLDHPDSIILFPAEATGKTFDFPLKSINLVKREIEFIRAHAKVYYSVILFRGLLNDSRIATDLLRKTFNESFPKTFRLSVEGSFLLKELEKRK